MSYMHANWENFWISQYGVLEIKYPWQTSGAWSRKDVIHLWHRLFRIWVFWLHTSYFLKVSVIPKGGWARSVFSWRESLMTMITKWIKVKAGTFSHSLAHLESVLILPSFWIENLSYGHYMEIIILSRATTKGAPVNSSVRTCGGLKVVFPHFKYLLCHYITHIEYILSLTMYK